MSVTALLVAFAGLSALVCVGCVLACVKLTTESLKNNLQVKLRGTDGH